MWADQEIGFAVGRRVPVISVRAGRDPYGFIGRYQALPFDDDPNALADQICRLLIANEATCAAMGNSMVAMMEDASCFQNAKDKIPLLKAYTGWTPELLGRLEQAVEDNSQVGDAHGVPAAIRAIVDAGRRAVP